jgi:geranylgeranyl pyrophosphate synthase
LTGELFFDAARDLLPRVEERMRSQTNGDQPGIRAALLHLLSSGGKRIRPALTLITGRMLGADTERLVTLAAAIELLHTATLVHDDLIDGSLVRRGIPTLNAQWSSAATVLTGDFIFARAAKLSAETNSVPAMRLFAETLATIVNGEIAQLFEGRGIASREHYYQRIYAKTASLFETATTTVAMISPVSDVIRERVRCYGYEIGMAFQIVDDILDFTSDQTTLGKPVASDLRQGLVTLPVLYYQESHSGDADLQAALRESDCDEACFQRLVTAIRQSGAITQAFEEARQFVARGVAALAELPDSPERWALIDLAEYIIDRRL